MAETFPFGAKTSVFKVAGKMFALSQLAEYPLRVSLKCEPQLAEQLRATYSAVIPGYHLNKFVTGLYQASEVRDDLDEPWLAGAMTIVIVLALMIVACLRPRGPAPARDGRARHRRLRKRRCRGLARLRTPRAPGGGARSGRRWAGPRRGLPHGHQAGL
jgi:YjbR